MEMVALLTTWQAFSILYKESKCQFFHHLFHNIFELLFLMSCKTNLLTIKISELHDVPQLYPNISEPSAANIILDIVFQNYYIVRFVEV